MGIGTRQREREECFEDMFMGMSDVKKDYDTMIMTIDLVRMKMQCMKMYLDCDFILRNDEQHYLRDLERIDGCLEDLSNQLTSDYESYRIN